MNFEQEADNWTTLTSDLDSILATKDINAVRLLFLFFCLFFLLLFSSS